VGTENEENTWEVILFNLEKELNELSAGSSYL
jgi:hypothetical protein